MKSLSIALVLIALTAGCSTFRESEPLPAADRLDLDRFMGHWFVIASMPSMLDGSAHNALHYIERLDRGFNITYQFNVDGFDGELRAYSSSATVTNPGINTEWSVRIAWPFNRTYQIIHVSDDYGYAIVGHPDRSNVWILSRTRSMDDPTYSDAIMRLQGLGYNVGRIRKVPQQS